MRLIDADMIIEGAEWCKKHSNKSDEMYFDEIIERVNSYPTIKAIPIKWLENLMRDARKEGMNPEVANGVNIILWNWYNGRKNERTYQEEA